MGIDVLKSVFSIRDREFRIEGRRGYYKEEKHRGFAVAISPKHLLTAAHCVPTDDTSYLLTQPEQNIRIEDGFRVVCSDKDLDLAVVEVPEELTFYRTVVTSENKPRFSEKLVLANHYNDIAQVLPVSKCLFTTQNLDYVPYYYVSSYKMPVRAVGGYSGSPLFTEDGRVASVTVKAHNKRQDRVEAVSGFIKALGFAPLNVPFEAVDPNHVVRFVTECNI